MQQPLKPSQRDEVMRRAVQLHSDASEDAEMVAAQAATAAELQIPPAVLAEAEAQVRLQTALEAQKGVLRRQFLRRLGVGAALSVVSVIALAELLQPRPMRWFAMAPREPWTLATNPGTSAKLSWGEDSGADANALVTIEHFALPFNQHFFANLNLPLQASDLQGHDTIQLKLKKRGTIDYARVYIEGDNERWRSDLLPLSETWQDHKLKFDRLEPQHRVGDDWHKGASGSIRDANRLSIKFGWYVNEVDRSGEVGIAAVGFQ